MTAILALTLAACSESEPESEANVPAAATEEVEEAPAKGATRETPYMPGETFEFGDWEISLGETDTDATQRIIDAQLEEYGDDEAYTTPPDEGHVYITVPVTATYKGADSDDPAFALSFAYVSADGNTFGDMILGVSIPNDLSDAGELYAGATGKGDVLQMVPREVAEGGVWRISENSIEPIAGDVYVAASGGQ